MYNIEVAYNGMMFIPSVRKVELLSIRWDTQHGDVIFTLSFLVNSKRSSDCNFIFSNMS
jgi:hypothetical protein